MAPRRSSAAKTSAKAAPKPKPHAKSVIVKPSKTCAKSKAKPSAAEIASQKEAEEDSKNGKKFWAGYKKLCDENKRTYEEPRNKEYMEQLKKAWSSFPLGR